MKQTIALLLFLLCLTGCSAQGVPQEQYDQLLAQQEQTAAALEQAAAELEQLQADSAPVDVAVSGCFTATVHAVMPDYLRDDFTPALAVVQCFQDTPFLVRSSDPELIGQLAVGESYRFTVEETILEKGHFGLTRGQVEGNFYGLEALIQSQTPLVASFRAPNEDEIGLDTVDLTWRVVE